ncbi:DUF4394 domain-containing protein [Mucilaginibacter terrae]|uniref:DUF4394 domain-containing protein n=1 Tax=Mucilaginibacter terrae TaxID=1955052 RepID=UPI003630DB18
MGALLLITGTFSACKDDFSPLNPAVSKPGIAFVALTNSTAVVGTANNAATTIQSQLIRYSASNVSAASSAAITINGLQVGESIVAIDYRPATGQLYGLGNTSRLYQIPIPASVTATSTTARLVGGQFSTLLSGTVAGFDFNPTVDRIRIVTTTGQNLRVNPEDATVAAVDGNLSGGTPAGVVSGAAYTNNISGATSTVLYDLDLVNRKLYRQEPPNNGTLVEVGVTGIPAVAATVNGGFDIDPSGVALAVAGTTLYQINVETGAATELGLIAIPNSTTGNNGIIGTSIIGIAIPTAPVAYAVDEANALYYFNTSSPSTAVTKPITGLQAGENVLGIDFRPFNGQLYALGSTSRLYTINLGTGAATAVGTVPFTTALAGTSFGFDFNPSADRIRIVSNTGQNLVADPNLGTVTASPNVTFSTGTGTPAVSASAYSNNFAGTTNTVLFSIDAATDRVYRQDAATGILTSVGALGVDVDAVNGFDIGIAGTTTNPTAPAVPVATGNGIALFTVGTTTRLYNVSIISGVATPGLEFPKKVRGFAIGSGF